MAASLGASMAIVLLLRLPHRKMVLTFPDDLRGFLRWHPNLHGQIARELDGMICTFYNAAASCKPHTAAA